MELVAVVAVTAPAGVCAQQRGAGDTIRVDTLAASPASRPRPARVATSSPVGSSITAWPDDDRTPGEPLPFARNPIPTTYPDVAIAIGLADFRSGFRGADGAFRAIEDSIRTGGYTVPSPTGVHSASMLLFTLDVSLNPSFDAALQLGRTNDKDTRLTLVGGLVSGRYAPPEAGNVSLLVGLGAGVYRFGLERHYGVPISVADAGGGYTSLDDIRLEGGGAYGTIAGRIAIRVDAHTAFEAAVQYFGMGDVSTDTGGAGRMSVNTSGTTWGVLFRVFL